MFPPYKIPRDDPPRHLHLPQTRSVSSGMLSWRPKARKASPPGDADQDPKKIGFIGFGCIFSLSPATHKKFPPPGAPRSASFAATSRFFFFFFGQEPPPFFQVSVFFFFFPLKTISLSPPPPFPPPEKKNISIFPSGCGAVAGTRPLKNVFF